MAPTAGADTPATEWAVPQEFAPATSYELRDQLGDLISRDLLGPWDGEREQFRPRAQGPRERYLVGMLGPKRLHVIGVFQHFHSVPRFSCSRS